MGLMPLDESVIEKAYRGADRQLRARLVRSGAIFGAIVVSVGIGLDHFFTPETPWRFLPVRLLGDLLLGGVFLATWSDVGRRFARLLSWLVGVLPILTMCWIVANSGGAMAPHFSAISLLLVGTCLLLPYTAREAVAVGVLVAVCYAVSCVIGSSREASWEIAIYNMASLAAIAAFCAYTCERSTARRRSDFRLQYEIEMQNEQLNRTVNRLHDTEGQLVQSEKMNSLGSLAAGLLHEINNPLNHTLMALDVAKMTLSPDDAERADIYSDIEAGLQRIAEIVSDLRAFAHPERARPHMPFPIRAAVQTALRFTAGELRSIHVDTQGVADVWAVGSLTQVTQVLVNLLTNAGHATENTRSLRPASVRVSAEPQGDRLVVRVWDNGEGIRPEVLPHVFDPFFTTKEDGKGLGLGLNICATMVQNHGGTIDAHSTPGKCTELVFTLPLSKEET